MKTYVKESGHEIYLMREGETVLGSMSSVEEAEDISNLINASDGMTNDEAVESLNLIKRISKTMVTEKITDAINRLNTIDQACKALSLEEAVRYLEHGKKMEELLAAISVDYVIGEMMCLCTIGDINNLLELMEGK